MTATARKVAVLFYNAVRHGPGASSYETRYAAHKHPNVLEWIAKHPRFVFHFTPTSASWLNAVEGFFANLAKKRLKRGVFRSLQELKDAIHRFLDETTQIQNRLPGPRTRTKSSPPSNEGTKR